MVAGGRSACNPSRDRCRASRRPPAVLGARRVEPAVRARSVTRADLDEKAWDISGTHVTQLENKNALIYGGFKRARSKKPQQLQTSGVERLRSGRCWGLLGR